MTSEPVIVDISSDEEGERDESSDENIDWISELLDYGLEEVDDSDDVVIVNELSTSRKQNCAPSAPRKAFPGGKLVDVDDECVMLDGDPDATIPKVNDADGGSEELLIVGEKGELACRDFPHPRHLCAKFLFRTTSHERHCDLCHCYVCDIQAPCLYWGTGQLITDHCHSTDKEEMWRTKRKNFKQGNSVPPPGAKLPDTSLSMTSIRMGAITSQGSSGPRQVNVRSFSRTGFTATSMSNHRNSNLQLRSVPVSNTFPSCPTRARLPQVMHIRQGTYPKRGRNGTLGPLVTTQNQRFKRMGAYGGAFRAVRGHGSSNITDTLVSENNNLNKFQDLIAEWESGLGNLHNFQSSNYTVSSLPESYTCSQTEAYDPDSPQLNLNENITASRIHLPTGTSEHSSDYPCVGPTNENARVQHRPEESTDPTAVSSTTTQAITSAVNQPPENFMLDFDALSWTCPPADFSIGPALLEMDPAVLYQYDNLRSNAAEL